MPKCDFNKVAKQLYWKRAVWIYLWKRAVWMISLAGSVRVSKLAYFVVNLSIN